MGQLLKSLRLFSDGTRVRLLVLLAEQELSVAELQQILSKGQSQISTHLSQLKSAGLVRDRREGKNSFYSLADAPKQLLDLLQQAVREIPEAADDGAALQLVLQKRRDRTRAYFDELAGRFSRSNMPGRSWQGIAQMLLALLPRMIIADLGAGEGALSQLLSPNAQRVIAVDNSERMVQVGTELAHRNGMENLQYRCGDLESVPIGDEEVDVALFSQSLHHAAHPDAALREAYRILRPGGRVVILDLMHHQFEEARELYADLWLGFTEVDLRRMLASAGFADTAVSVVHKDPEPPSLETVLAIAHK